jgi:hypothetical protein
MARTRKMVNLSIEETSGVDHPAHLHEGWLVMKASDPVQANPDRGEPDAPPVLKSTEEVQGMEDGMEKADGTMSFEDMKAALEKANARIAEMEKEMGGKKKGDGELPEFLRKDAPEEVRKAFEDMQKAIDSANVLKAAAEETLLKERADRADAEAVVKARESYGALGLDAQMVGPALRRLADTDSDLAKSVEQALLAANAKVESADIFSEIGKGSLAAFGDAYGQAEAMAKSAVAEGRVPTFEQALSEVYASNPGLYDQYLAEQGK